MVLLRLHCFNRRHAQVCHFYSTRSNPNVRVDGYDPTILKQNLRKEFSSCLPGSNTDPICLPGQYDHKFFESYKRKLRPLLRRVIYTPFKQFQRNSSLFTFIDPHE